MQWLDLTLATPVDNLAADEVLLEEAALGLRPPVLRVWEGAHWMVVLGASRSLSRDVCASACTRLGVPIFKRCSGGGTVLLGPGALGFAVVVDHRAPELDGGICAIDGWVLERLVAQLRAVLTNEATPAAIGRMGPSDLVFGGRKFSGNAQRRLRRFSLFHGTILYDLDLRMVAQTLTIPDRQPAYRAGRSHADFLCNLPVERPVLSSALQRAFEAKTRATFPDSNRIDELADRIRARALERPHVRELRGAPS